MEKWRFLPYRVYSPAENMAIDEAIMQLHREKKNLPTLRFYGWEPATLSIGYFQRVDREINLDELKRSGFGFVRRLTGGRAVLHDHELTYSVIVSEAHPLMPPTVSESYRVISQGLLEGFRLLGIEAELTAPHSKPRGEHTAACFDSPSDYELVIHGKKVAGSAQVRKQGVILQHGSILLDLDIEALFSVLRFPSDQVRKKWKDDFRNKAVAIQPILQRDVSIEEVTQAFFDGFQKGMGIQLEMGELSLEEIELAKRLVKEKYGNDQWNRRR